MLKKIKVIGCKYAKEPDALLITGESEDGIIHHQVPSSCFSFKGKNKESEMKKTAILLKNKYLNVEYQG